MKIEQNGSFKAHINELPIWFAIKALAFGIEKLDVNDEESKRRLVQTVELYALYVRDKYGGI